MTILHTVTEVVVGAQVELAVFLLAFSLHLAVFGRQHINSEPNAGTKRPGKATTPTAPGAVCEIRALLSQGVGEEDLFIEICKFLQAFPLDSATTALLSLFEAYGKAVPAEVLGALRRAARHRGLSLSGLLGTTLLKSYFGPGLRDGFREVLREVEEAEGGCVSPGTAVMAMKAALYWDNDLQAAASRLPAVAPVWRALDGATASAAPQGLLQKMLSLGAEQAALPFLLKQLFDSGLLLPWVLEALLEECARANDAATSKEAWHLSREAGGAALTAGTYRTLLRHAGSEEEALQLFEEAAERGLATKDVLLAAVEGGHPAVARAVLAALPREPPAEVASALVRAAAAPGSMLVEGLDGPQAALQLLERFPRGLELPLEELRLLALVALAEGRHEALRRLLAPGGSRRRVALVKALGAERRLREAEAVFRCCPGQTACLFNALVDACVASGALKAAERLLAEATASGQADVITYNTIIKAHLKAGDLARARAALEAARAAGHTPTCVTFNELLDFAVKTSPTDAWGIIEEMQACGLKPDQVTCSILLKSIQAHTKASDVERGMRVVDSFGDDIDEVLLGSLCEACVRAGRPDLLRKPLRRQHSNRKVHIKGAHTYGSIIRAYGFVNDVESVWETWHELRRKSIPPTTVTLGCMVEALVAHGQVEAGRQVVREMREEAATRHLVNAVVYCTLLKGFSHQKRFSNVWSIYEEMRAEGVEFTLATFNALVDACARCGEMRRLPGLIEEMTKLDLKPNVVTCSAILKGYCQENSWAQLGKAFTLLGEMKRDLQFEPDEITYNTLLDGCARMGDLDRGIKVLREMEEEAVRPSNFTLSVLVKLANRGGNLEKAFELTEEITKKYSFCPNIHVYNNLIHACIQHRDLRRGLETFEGMLRSKVRPDVRTYTVLIRACVDHGELQDAAGLIRAAFGLRGAHPRTAGAGTSFVQLRGGLPPDVVGEAMEGLAAASGGEAAIHLLRELRRLPGVQLDSKLSARLAAKAISCRR